MKKILILITLLLVAVIGFSQAPKTFKYQAVLRDANGKIIASQAKTVVVDILQGSTTGIVTFSETHNTSTTDQGLINLDIGSVNNTAFDAINWAKGPYFLRITVDGTEMGTSQLLSVPYSMFAGTVREVKAPADIAPDEPIFQVLNTYGEVVFAVYNSGVRVVFDESALKGAKGGFTVGGRTGAKQGTINEYVSVNKDSTVISINDQLVKGARSGFVVGGRNPGKSSPFEFLRINRDSTTFLVRSDALNPTGTSFNVMTVGPDNIPKNLLSVTVDTTKIGTSLNVARDIVTTGGITAGSINTGTLTDKRDAIVYKTVTIGTQVWMAENLRARKYLNGDPIPYVKTDTTWNQLTTGAYCFYNNDTLFNAFNYGGLYNYYTVIDSRGLCPTGWHAPKVNDYQNLVTYLGGDTAAGGKLKARGNTFWTGLNVGATNSSGFNGLPGGYFPPFVQLGFYGYYWTATESSVSTAICLVLNSDGAQIVLPTNPVKTQGFSVRCIKD